jgi:hypothetical protein
MMSNSKSGTVVFDDLCISYFSDKAGQINYKITRFDHCIAQDFTVDDQSFFRALSIALHPTNFPDYDRDFMWAEAIMPKGEFRWIP